MIKLTEHYKERYKERVSKSTKNMQIMANRAFEFGTDLEKIKNIKLKKQLEDRFKNSEPFMKCKIYRGYVWLFSATTIVTVYAMPIIRAACDY